MARGEQILRQWNLLKTLQTRGEGLTLLELADEFEVSERTIQRDLALLEELGFPLEYEEDPYGKRYWRLPHDFFRTGPLVLSLTEALSLHLAEDLFRPLAGTHFGDGLQGILEKIRSLLPAEALEHFRELDQIIYVRRTGLTDYTRHAEAIRVLSDAVIHRRTVDVTYRALWRAETYSTLFDPYGLVYFEDDLFLVGRSHRAQDVRIFKVARITQVEPTDRSFKLPPGFQLEERFRHSFGIFQPDRPPVNIVVRFYGPVANLIAERVWHESQRLEWLPPEKTLFEPHPQEPDTLLARFRLANLVEFKRWVKGYGDLAEIIKPDWLRREMRAELLDAAALYDR